jgi:dethiobiotin synthetase
LLGVLPAGSGSLDRTGFLEVARAGLSPQLGGSFDARAFRRTWEA